MSSVDDLYERQFPGPKEDVSSIVPTAVVPRSSPLCAWDNQPCVNRCTFQCEHKAYAQQQAVKALPSVCPGSGDVCHSPLNCREAKACIQQGTRDDSHRPNISQDPNPAGLPGGDRRSEGLSLPAAGVGQATSRGGANPGPMLDSVRISTTRSADQRKRGLVELAITLEVPQDKLHATMLRVMGFLGIGEGPRDDGAIDPASQTERGAVYGRAGDVRGNGKSLSEEVAGFAAQEQAGQP